MMATGDIKRKLTAIFSADVEGYSRLMGEDELATVETLTSYKEIMRKMIRQYRGRVVDSTGDNLLAEFASVVDAVQCAVEVQQVLNSKNETLPENRRMYFRIGINSGDVIEEGDLIYGDGVNVAARVESLAEGGGISISGTAYDQLGKKLPLGYEYLGEQSVKNIEKPVRVYRILTEAEAAGKVIGEIRPKTKQLRGAAIGGVVVLILVIGALAIWNFYFRPAFEPASIERMAFPLPEKPSIAVLPFDNLSGDPDQDHISDGITENIINALSKIPEMFIIARNSVFTYKGKPVKVQQVSEELGVRYVLEGSVQEAGERVRIRAQLIDAIAGHNLWSEQYDRDMKDLFELLDEITHKIVVALQVKLTEGEQALMRPTNNLQAWGYAVKGSNLFLRFNKGDNAKARTLFKRAVELDPNYAWAWSRLAWTHTFAARLGWSEDRAASIKRATEIGEKALALDESLPDTYALLGNIYYIQRQYDKAVAEGEKAVLLDPNSAENHTLLGMYKYTMGEFEETIQLVKKAIRLQPYYPDWYLLFLGAPQYFTRQYEDAIATFKNCIDRSRETKGVIFVSANCYLAATYIELGREEEARFHAAEAIKVRPDLSLDSYFRKVLFFKEPRHLDRLLNAFRKAGIPDHPPLPLPDNPSIAVLPFVNMSGDPEQEYISDGISVEIINALSILPRMFVIARASSFKYKGKEIDVRTVGRELGVRYVLEGSFRKANDKVRITAQLVDAKTGNNLWVERYDRDFRDLFALQDDITFKILTALRVQLTSGETGRLSARGTHNLSAHLAYLRGTVHWLRSTKEDNIAARRFLKEAIDLDPRYPAPYVMLGAMHMMDLFLQTTKSPKESLKRAVELTQKAIDLDDSLASAHALLGWLYTLLRQYDKGIAEGRRAVDLSPNGFSEHSYLSLSLRYAGRCDEALPVVEKAIRLSPLPGHTLYRSLAWAHICMGRYEKAIAECKRALELNPDDIFLHLALAIAHNLSGREEEARAEVKEALRINLEFSLDKYKKHALMYKNEAYAEKLVSALRKAGLK
jgi:adenylate cyclase